MLILLVITYNNLSTMRYSILLRCRSDTASDAPYKTSCLIYTQHAQTTSSGTPTELNILLCRTLNNF